LPHIFILFANHLYHIASKYILKPHQIIPNQLSL
jgi:hypothetical protein